MRHTKVIGPMMVGLMVCVLGMGLLLPIHVQAIKEVTPTPSPDAPAQATQVPDATALPDGTLDDQLGAAYNAFEQGDYQEAVELTTAIVEQYPEAAEGYLLRGVAYTQLNNVNRAIDDFTRAIRILPYDWTAYTFRAAAYVQLDKIGEALDDYDTAIELNPRYAAAYTGRAQILDAQGDSQNAQIDQLIAEGITRVEREDFAGAISKFTQAIDLDSTPERRVANAYYNRALSHYSLRDLDAAIEDYGAAIELDPNMHDAYLGRGIAYREVEETANAGVDFAKRIELLAETTTENTLEIGVSLDVDMSYGQVYHFTFEGTAGQRVDLLVKDVSQVGVDPLIALLDPDGTPIAGDDDMGGVLDSLVENFELPADGTYTLVVSHANGGYDGRLSVLVSEN
jgi:tetratricopeptide (TPR) repeat protein